MSRIEELIAQQCPDGVEHKPLGDVGTFIRGNGLQKKDFVDAGFPCIHYGEIYTYYGTSATATRSFVAPELAQRLRRAKTGDLVVATTSENVEDVCKAVAWLGDGEVAVSGDSYVFSHSLDPLYLSFFFGSRMFLDQKMRYVSGTKVKRVAAAAMERVSVPVPPLEIQREISETLVRMEELNAELNAELKARRGQYEHYRGQLLTFGDGVPLKSLGEVATIGTGSHDTKDAVPEADYVFYARGRDPLRLDSFDFDERAIITAGDGVGVGKVFHFAEGKYALHQRAYRVVPRAGVNARFIYHYLVNDFARYLERTSVHASVTSLRRPMFLQYPVALPPVELQDKIAAKLDAFDALVNDISIGLPAEIAARRKQYEHYRDRLLTFEELAA